MFASLISIRAFNFVSKDATALNDKTKNSNDVAEEKVPAEKPKRQTRRKAVAEVQPDEPDGHAVPEPVKTMPKTASKRSKVEKTVPEAKSVEKPNENEIGEKSEVPVVAAGRRTRKNSQMQTQSKVTAVETPTNAVEQKQDEVAQNESKPKRGRQKKVDTANTVEPEPSTKQRKPRGRTVSKTEDDAKTEVAEKKAEKDEEKLENITEPTKPKSKRNRKADTDADNDDPEPTSKRSRNTKQAKKEEPPKEKNIEAAITSPISTRTRRRK